MIEDFDSPVVTLVIETASGRLGFTATLPLIPAELREPARLLVAALDQLAAAGDEEDDGDFKAGKDL